jgi:hypothetical protein
MLTGDAVEVWAFPGDVDGDYPFTDCIQGLKAIVLAQTSPGWWLCGVSVNGEVYTLVIHERALTPGWSG